MHNNVEKKIEHVPEFAYLIKKKWLMEGREAAAYKNNVVSVISYILLRLLHSAKHIPASLVICWDKLLWQRWS